MAKLYFYYSAMNAGKSTNLLQSSHNYQERGMNTLLLTPGLDIDAGELRSGLSIKSYLGEWNWVPEFTQMTAKAESLGKAIDLNELPAEKNAGLLFSGYLHIQEAGDWTFHCQSTGGVIFKIHNKLVIDGDYKNDGAEISTTVKLDQGIHPYRLYYKTTAGKPALKLEWEGPNGVRGPLAADALRVDVP